MKLQRTKPTHACDCKSFPVIVVVSSLKGVFAPYIPQVFQPWA
uniref:Uncharacterized protein n=1 Tax=Arundo donax TaxID=35708 RepID=A0A0A9B6X2_ARUDO